MANLKFGVSVRGLPSTEGIGMSGKKMMIVVLVLVLLALVTWWLMGGDGGDSAMLDETGMEGFSPSMPSFDEGGSDMDDGADVTRILIEDGINTDGVDVTTELGDKVIYDGEIKTAPDPVTTPTKAPEPAL